MIASRLGLGVLLAVALALALALARGGGRAPVATARALMPADELDRITALAWTHPGDARGEVRLVRDAAGRWQWVAPAVPADPAAVADVIAALRGARWHRVAARARAGTIDATLAIGSRTFGIGDELAGSEQIWLDDGDRAVLVDRWVARALDPGPLALRIRTPLADAHTARAIEVRGDAAGALAIAGQPRMLRGMRLAPARVAALEQALAALELVQLAPPAPGAADVQIRPVPGAELRGGGACPGAPARIAVTGSTSGDGCVTAEAWQAVIAAIAPLAGPLAAIVDPRPAAIDVVSATLPDGTLTLGGRPRVGDHAADPVAVAAWLAALAAPAEVVPLPAGAPGSQDGGAGRSTIALLGRAGEALTLAVYPRERVVARTGEPIALRPTPAAWAALTAPAAALRDSRPWVEDATAITSITIDGATFARGAVIGEWTPGDGAALERLAAQLAAPAGGHAEPAAFRAVHRVAFTTSGPGAPPVVHALELGAADVAGCPVRFAGDAQRVGPALCVAVAAAARPVRNQ